MVFLGLGVSASAAVRRRVIWEANKHVRVSGASVTFFSPSPRRNSSNLDGTLSSGGILIVDQSRGVTMPLCSLERSRRESGV